MEECESILYICLKAKGRKLSISKKGEMVKFVTGRVPGMIEDFRRKSSK